MKNRETNLRLREAVPLDLEIRTGAGESNLDLSALDASNLRVEVGAGTTDLDLSGNWDHDVSANGLMIEEGGYVNKALGSVAHTLTLNLHAGVGSVVLTTPQ